MDEPTRVFESEDCKYVLKIYQDDDPGNPREEYDNMGTMVCWHSDYNLGDKHSWSSPEDWMNEILGEEDEEEAIAELERLNAACFKEDGTPIPEKLNSLQKEFREAKRARFQKRIDSFDGVMLPLCLLDQSGLWIRTGKFACDPGDWDTSHVGFIYVTKETIIKEYGDDSKESRAKAESYLEGEVQTYSQYLENDVYGFMVEDDEETHIVSCWDFYGWEPCGNQDDRKAMENNGIWDYLSEEVRQLVDPDYVQNDKGYWIDKQLKLALG